jgi:hypothetical protein
MGMIRPLHGLNKGPLAPGGLVDVSGSWRTLRPPFARLHDCHWPNPDVIDMHALFPDPGADPKSESSYTFALTDEYLAATMRKRSRGVTGSLPFGSFSGAFSSQIQNGSQIGF